MNITIENDARPESYEAFHVMLERTSGLNGRVTLKPVNGVITIMGDVGRSDQNMMQCFSLSCLLSYLN